MIREAYTERKGLEETLKRMTGKCREEGERHREGGGLETGRTYERYDHRVAHQVGGNRVFRHIGLLVRIRSSE